MNPAPEIAPMLKRLRFSGILDSLDARNRQAIEKKLPYTEFLALLIQDELARRDQKKFDLRLRRAGFQSTKTLDRFDFDFNPSIDQALIRDLATCRFLQEERVCVLIVGPCGDFVGPFLPPTEDGEEAEEVLPLSPSRWYLTASWPQIL